MSEALSTPDAKSASATTRSTFMSNVPKGMKTAFMWALGLTVVAAGIGVVT